MKKGLALLLVMVLAMTMLLVACNQDSWVKATPSKGLKFESNGDGTCAVVGIGECTDTDVVIPKKSPDGDRVTSIAKMAFSLCTDMTSLTLLGSVTSIGDGAFYGCTGLTSITISDSVTSIGDSAFSDCTGLTDIMIPDSITSIGMYAFTGCTGLTSVTIGNGVASIEEGAFWACTSLTDVYYTGSESEWAAIEIGFEFGGLETVGLETATIHYNYVPEE